MRRLIETLEIQVAVPDPSIDIVHDNMLAAWSGVPYGQLSLLLVHLKFLAMVHQTHHWTAKGDPFYGDHLLFERLYNETTEDIDDLAEKTVGLGNEANVNLSLQLQQINQLVQGYGAASTIPSSSELARRSLGAEVAFLRCAAAMADSLHEHGLLTRGLDNMLQGLEDRHESHVYLLKQRCSGGV